MGRTPPSPRQAESDTCHRMLSLRVDNGAKARTLDHQNPIDVPKQRPEMTTEEADGGDEAFPASIYPDFRVQDRNFEHRVN
jgi:hypothetical protein